MQSVTLKCGSAPPPRESGASEWMCVCHGSLFCTSWPTLTFEPLALLWTRSRTQELAPAPRHLGLLLGLCT